MSEHITTYFRNIKMGVIFYRGGSAFLLCSGSKLIECAEFECGISLNSLLQESKMSGTEDNEHTIVGLHDIYKIGMDTHVAPVPFCKKFCTNIVIFFTEVGI